MNPFTRHPNNCMAALLKGVPMPFMSELGICHRCSEASTHLAVLGNQYNGVCESHAREFRLVHGLKAAAEPAPVKPVSKRTRRNSKKGVSN